MNSDTAQRATRQAMITRTLVLAIAWLVLAGMTPGSWVIGLPVVLLAAWISLQLAPPLPYRINPRGLLRLVGYFIREALLGGWDVAMRTMSPRLRIAPGEMDYTSSLPSGLPMVLFTASVSLLPGTLSQRFDGRRLSLHLLNTGVPQQQALGELEQRIAAMLGIELETSHG